MTHYLYRLRSTWICFRRERLGLRAAWAKAGWIWGGPT